MRIESQERSDAVLVEAAQGGRLDSFGALYQRYHNPIVALAYARLGDKHAAEDAAQEVFAIACRDLVSLRDPDKFGPWYFDGFRQARISAVLDITPSAVNGRLVRAKRKVAQWLKRDGFGS
jgi:DNA-directed RNA polymerase specialized sigma24 family protein